MSGIQTEPIVGPEATELNPYSITETEQAHVETLQTFLTLINEEGANVSIGGGYALDGLVGEITRDHNDLDVFVADEYMDTVLTCVQTLGYTVTRDDIKYIATHTDWDFVIELISVNTALDILRQVTGKDFSESDLIPSTPNAMLKGTGIEFKTPTLEVQKSIIGAQNERAKEEGWPQYKHAEHQQALLDRLEVQ